MKEFLEAETLLALDSRHLILPMKSVSQSIERSVTQKQGTAELPGVKSLLRRSCGIVGNVVDGGGKKGVKSPIEPPRHGRFNILTACNLTFALECGSMPKNMLYFGDNLTILREHIEDESVDLVYPCTQRLR